MKITIDRSTLSEALSDVNKAVDGKTSIQILTGIKLEVSDEGLTLTANDNEKAIQTLITEVEVTRVGAIVVPAKFFVEIVKKLPEEEIEITVDGLQVSVKSGKSELDLVGLDAEEFPELPKMTVQQSFTLKGSVLKSLIKQTAFAVSTNEQTPVLNSENWSLSNGELTIIATDRHRLARLELKVDGADGIELSGLNVTGKHLNELSKIIPDNLDVEVSASYSHVLFRMGDLMFYSRIVDGSYPDTSKIIHNKFQTEITVNTASFTNALDRAYLLSREEKTNIAKLKTMGSYSIELSSKSGETSKVTEQVEISEMTGDELTISFNSKYMLEALKVIESEQIHIGFTGVMSPIIITPVGGSKALHLVLPYRTTT
jgi:DNA polymerase III subunit beta